jgi:putative tributyrin esterase
MSEFFTTETGDLPEFHPGFRMLTVKSNALQRRADITLFDGSVAMGKQVSGLPVVILLHG